MAIETYLPYLSWPELLIHGSLKDFLSKHIEPKRKKDLFVIPATTDVSKQESKNSFNWSTTTM